MQTKKFLSVFLAVIMVIGLVPMTVFATEATCVATVGETGYDTLEAAISAADSGDTVTLTADYTAGKNGPIMIGKDLTLDLGGKTLSGATDDFPMIMVTDGTLTIKNGTASNTGSYDLFNVMGNLVIESGTYSASGNLIYAGSSSAITLNGGTFTGALTLDPTDKEPNVTIGTGVTIAAPSGYTWDDNGKLVEDTATPASTYYQAPGSSEPVGMTWEDALAAAKENDGGTITINEAGNYTMPNQLTNMALTIKGGNEAIKNTIQIVMTSAINASGSTIHFDTIAALFDNDNYEGLQHAVEVTYTNCNHYGTEFLYAPVVTYTDCGFGIYDNTTEYLVWTYGSEDVTFTNCVFDTEGKAILVYNEATDFTANITLSACAFRTDSTPAYAGKAAVETGIVDGSTNKFNLSFTDCTADNGFTANNTESNLWGNKNSMTFGTGVDVTIDGVNVTSTTYTNWIQVADTSWYTDANKTVETYVRGDNTFSQDTYTLTTAEQLAGLAKLVNEGNNFSAVVIKLGADIDLSAYAWTPIGNTSDTTFRGHFDGGNHTIKGLNMANETYAGLFGYVWNNGTNYLSSFENVTFENVSITGENDRAAALFARGYRAQRHEWYGGVLQVHNVTVKGDVKIEGASAGSVVGDGWLNVRMDASNIVVDVNEGSCVKGTSNAGGVFASSPHSGGGSGNIEKITCNIDVIGSGNVGGIAGVAGWYWDNLTYTGTVTADGVSVKAGLIFGSIADNAYWSNNHAVDYCGMTNLKADGASMTINGESSTQLFPESGNWGATFKYVDGKVHEESALVSIDGAEGVLMTWPEAMDAVAGKTATITLTLASTSGVTRTTEYGLEVPANTKLTIDLGGYRMYGTIYSEGDLTVKNGQIYSYENVSAIESNSANAVLTIEDGVTLKSYRHALRIDGGKATINGGTFETWGVAGGTSHALNAGGAVTTEVTINGGTFIGVAGNADADSGMAVNAQNNATVTINGGDFSKGKNWTLFTGNTTGVITVTGGTFDQDPTEVLAAGYIVTETNGVWTVAKDPTYVAPVAKVGDLNYTSIQAAIDAAAAGTTQKIFLLSDTAETGINIPAGMQIVLNLGGFTLTGDIYSEGRLSVLDGTIINTDKSVSAIESNGNAAELLVNNVTITSNRHALRIEGGMAIIGSGTFSTLSVGGEQTSHALNAGGKYTTIVAINGGTFNGIKSSALVTNADSGAAVCAQANATVTINANTGSFSGGQNKTLYTTKGGAIIINDEAVGAIFDQDPSEYLAEGLVAVKTVDGYVVSKITEASFVVSADKTEVKTGEEVTITVTLNGKDLVGGSWTLSYDATKFEYTGTDDLSDEFETSTPFNSKAIATYTFKAIAQKSDSVVASFTLSEKDAWDYNGAMSGKVNTRIRLACGNRTSACSTASLHASLLSVRMCMITITSSTV